MDYGLYVSAAGADTQTQRMEVLSHNMANVDTPGFKEELAVLQARYSREVRDGTDVAGSGGLNDLGSGVSMAETVTNFSEGLLKQTQGKWDMAIHGEGFFVVDNEGEQLLTRAGNFQVDANGQLLTQQGYPVLSAAGTPIQIDLSVHSQLHKDGYLEHSGGGEFVALKKPQSLGDLVRVGENLFRPLGPLTDVDAGQRRVESGFLEISGVRPTRTMLELIETSRMYEANVRMIQNHDQMTGALISRILRAR
ncbi:MAG: flagellar hook-basal body protein [Planctomycetaceae bacterium]|nr:flagellar hook-basal body protein [Planctomycetaceae bacterium]